MENDKNTKPPSETRPRPGGETRPRPPEGETRSMSQVAAAYVLGTATGAGLATGKLVVDGVASKVTDALTSKDEGPEVVIPPRRNSKSEG